MRSLIVSTFLPFVIVSAARAADVAIVGATLVDVTHAGRSQRDVANATILMRDGVVKAVGTRVALPPGTLVIDASGGFAVPGLIDGFGSMRTQGFADAYLYEGVTTVYVNESPVGGDGEQTIAETAGGPRVLRGATLSGYASDGSLPAAHPWTDHRLHDRPLSDTQLGNAIAALSVRGGGGVLLNQDVLPAQMTAVVAEARRRHLATMTVPAFTSYPYAIHAGIGALLRSDRYQTALAPTADRLAYAGDPTGKGAVGAVRAVCKVDLASPALVALAAQLAKSRTALMPMLSIEATADDVGAPNPWQSRSAVFVKPSDLDDPVDPASGARPYLESHPDRRQALQACALHRQAIDARLHALGTTYLAGSASPAFGIIPGGGLHQELRLLQRIGLTAREALAAATSNFADVYGWESIGRIEAGRAGDVLIVGSDPRLDVSALDDIRVLVHDGKVIDRKALLDGATGRGAAGR